MCGGAGFWAVMKNLPKNVIAANGGTAIATFLTGALLCLKGAEGNVGMAIAGATTLALLAVAVGQKVAAAPETPLVRLDSGFK